MDNLHGVFLGNDDRLCSELVEFSCDFFQRGRGKGIMVRKFEKENRLYA